MYHEHGKVTVGSKFSIRSKASREGDSIGEDEVGFGAGYKTKVEGIIMGKHMPTMKRSGSEVSI